MVHGKMFAFTYEGKLVIKLLQEDMGVARESRRARPFIHGRNGQFGDWMGVSSSKS